MTNKIEDTEILSKIPQSAPILLFPLRLETHFRENGNQNQLCVRIFPDEILLNQHKQKLSKEEFELGQHFWFNKLIKKNGNNEADTNQEWQELCSKLPLHRAAWVCRQIKPTKKELDAFGEQASIDELTSFFENRKKILLDENYQNEFTQPELEALPDRFLFIGKLSNGTIIKQASKKVDKNISASINFNEEIDFEQGDNPLEKLLKKDPSIKWMFDYNDAVEKGMAITIDIDKNVNEFDYIYVIGVNNEESSSIFESLINGHNYTSSLQILNPRTPTNNLDEKKSNDNETLLNQERYKIEVNTNHEELKEDKDSPNAAQILADLLGVSYKNCLSYIGNYDSKQDSETKEAYKSLWTELRKELEKRISGKTLQGDNWSNLTQEETKALQNKYQNQYLEFIKSFIINYLRCCGNIPSIKIGNLPYGILPVSDFRKIKSLFSQSGERNNFFNSLMNDLFPLRKKLSDNIPDKTIDENDRDKYNQTPYSSSFIERPIITSPLIEKNSIQPLTKNESIINFFIDLDLFSAQPIKDTKDYIINENSLFKKLTENSISDNNAHNYVTEFIDLFSYRIDAWFNGILDYLRKQKEAKEKSHPYFGTYGWVRDLKKNQRKPANSTEVRKIREKFDLDDNEKIYTTTGNDNTQKEPHYILAPSIQHALSAAVLRSAYTDSQKSLHTCVNLSSIRVRQAMRLIDGIKSGMALSVVLGSDLERYLHDYNLDVCINPLRQLFPQKIVIDSKTTEASSYIMQVVNGEQLLANIIDKWQWNDSLSKWLLEKKDYSWLSEKENDQCKEIKDYLKNNKKKEKFNKAIERLMDSYDALKDLLISEGVHRLTMGDKTSYFAISQFIAEGKGNIPDPEILKFPGEKVVISHKAALLLPQSPNVPKKTLSIADPAVDAWVTSLICDIKKIYFTIVTGNSKKRYSLGDLDVSASEYLYLSAYPETLKTYLEVRWRVNNKNFKDPVSILESCEECEEQISLSLEEDILRMETLRDILNKGSSMNVSDWKTVIKNKGTDQDEKNELDEDFINRNDLENRYKNILNKMKGIHNNLKEWKKRSSSRDNVIQAYNILCNCVEIGMVNSLVDCDIEIFTKDNEIDENRFQILKHHIEEVEKNLKDKIDAVESEISNKNSLTSKDYISAIQKLTLKNIKVFPLFHLPNTIAQSANEMVKKGLIENGCSAFIGVDENKFDKWEDEIAEVRSGMKSIRNLTLIQNALDSYVAKVSILQKTSSLQDTDSSQNIDKTNPDEPYWMGLPVPEKTKDGKNGEAYLTDADSLVLYNNIQEPHFNDCDISGFIFDSWIEYIPYKKHNAGLIFQYDRPDNEAPQAILYAMHPSFSTSKNQNWDLDTLTGIFDDTFSMMKCRLTTFDKIIEDDNLSKIFPLFMKGVEN